MKIINVLTLVILLIGSWKAEAQTSVSAPVGTVVVSNPVNANSVGDAGGRTWTYTNPTWPLFESPCYTYGFPDVLTAVINGDGAIPCDGSGMANLTYNAGGLTNLAIGRVEYSGVTQIAYDYFGIPTVQNVDVRLVLRFTNTFNANIPVLYSSGRLLIRATQNFKVQATLEARPGLLWYPVNQLSPPLVVNTGNTCINFNPGSFYTFSVTPTASNTSPYCIGNTIALSGSVVKQASGAATYSWTGPPAFSSGIQNPTRVNATLDMAGTYNLRVTDAIGCSALTTTDVIIDNTLPEITCPSNITVNANAGSCGSIVNYATPIGTDNCAGVVTYRTEGLPSGAVFPVGTTQVTHEVTDGGGNVASCSFTVTVIDNQFPTLTCPSNITVNNTPGICGSAVTYVTPVGSDNCGSAIVVRTSGLASGSVFPIGVTTVTHEVIDAVGNKTSCSFTVTVNDTELPVLSCPADIVVDNSPGVCGAVVNYTTPVGVDNCSGATTVRTAGLASGSVFPIGVTTVSHEVTDASGNTADCSFTVTVNDTELPTITCPGNIVINNTTGACARIVTYTVPVGTDNCPGATTVRTAGRASGAAFPVGVTTVTYEVTDASGNKADCSFTVTVNDSQVPTITCPSNIVVNNTPGTCGAVVNYTAPVGSDNCAGGSTVRTAGLPSGSVFPVGVTTVTHEVTDAAGNATSCSFTVTVNDTQFPVISCPANIVANADAGTCGTVVNYVTPVGSDNCAGSTTVRTSGLASGSVFPVGVTTVTHEVTDAVGITASCSFTVTVNDTELPVLSCPADIVVDNSPGVCGAVVNYTTPVGVDNCSGATTIRTAGLASGSVFPIGVTTVSHEVTDASGNTADCSFTVTVNDTELPTITCPGNIVINNTTGACARIVTYTVPVGTDNCPGATTVRTAGRASGAAFPVGVTTVTYEVTDASGNKADCSFTVTVNDSQLPTITCPSNIVVNNTPGTCGAVVNYTAPVGSDNCAGGSTVRTAGLPSGSVFPVGVTTVTYEVTDAAGNATSCSFTVTVNDTQLPLISCPSNIVANADAGTCGTVVNYVTPVGSDNCAGSTTVRTTGVASGSVFPVGVTTVTHEVTDASGNIVNCSFTVTVNDIENPVITCPGDIVTNSTPGVCGAVVNYTLPVVADNCPGATITRTDGLASGATFPVGNTIITYEATDISGNKATCSFTVTVNDTEIPVLTCPADIVIGNTPGACSAVVNYTAPVGTDNCSGVTTVRTSGLASGATFPLGISTITFEATDAAGNKATCSFTVTVNDTEGPVITCPSNITVNKEAGTCGAVVSYVVPTSTDNCGATTTNLLSGLGSGATFPVGVSTETYEAVDAVGNKSTCTFTITVTDTELPNIVCPANITINNEPGTCGAVVNYTEPVGIGNCGGVTTVRTSGLASGSVFEVGIHTVTYEVTDVLGNKASCSFTITVNDTDSPVISCPSDIAVSNTAGTCGAVVNYTAPVGTDNCSGVTTNLVSGLASGATFPIGATVVTYEAVDASGNKSTCSFTVTVTDTEAPIFSCNSDITINNDPGTCGAIVNYATPTATDNCSGATITQTSGLASGSVFPLGATIISYEAEDAVGNKSTCSFTVNVTDTEPPVINCLSDISVDKDANTCGAIVNYTAPIGTDNCAGVTTTMTAGFASGDEFPIGITTVTYEAEDASGNKTTCSFTVTVNDADGPAIVCPADIVVGNDPGVCGALVNYVAPVGTDNCGGVITNLVSGLGSGSIFPVGVTIETYEATDAAGNKTTCSFTVTVNDTELPVLTCTSDIVVSNDPGICDAVVSYSVPLATDNCGIVTTNLVSGLASGATFPEGVTTIEYEAVDAAGNKATCSFTVTVNKTVGPQILCPSDIVVDEEIGKCGAIVSYTAPTGTDNCSGVSSTVLISGLGSGSLFPVGVTTEVYETTDISGNTNTCSFTVTVNDLSLPTIVCPNDTIIYSEANQCGTLFNYPLPISSDQCGSTITSLLSGLGSGSVFPIGDNIEEYAAYDLVGNSATCTFTITVEDTISPVIVCPTDVEVESDSELCGALLNYDLPVATDNCSNVTTVLLSGLGYGSTFPVGVSVEEYGAYDAVGNLATCTFTVTVTDVNGPAITCPNDTIVPSNVSLCGALVDYAVPIGKESCGSSTTVLLDGLGTGSVFPNGVSTEEYAVFDAVGNMQSCTFTITVKDTVGPQMTCVDDIVECFTSSTQVIVYNTPTATDGCGNVTVTQTEGLPSGSVFPVGTTVNTFVAKDDNGNESICTFTVTITDNQTVALEEMNTCITAPEFPLTGGSPAGGTYEVEGVKAVSFNPPTFGVGSFDLKYIYKYGNGCESSVSTKINVYREVKATLPQFEQEYLNDGEAFELTGGQPAGGDYRGTAIVDNIFDPKNAEIGLNAVIYTYIDNGGCRYSATGYITVVESSDVVVYNTFTPNGDGMHDTWEIKNIHKYPGAIIEVYNRWGTRVYESNNYNNNWDGDNLPDATYFYVVDLKSGEKPLTGTLTIIR